MFENLAQQEPANITWRSYAFFYAVWCALGLAGFVGSFWKHGNVRVLGGGCYLSIFVLVSIFFLRARRLGLPSRRGLSAQNTILVMLGLLPILARDLFLK